MTENCIYDLTTPPKVVSVILRNTLEDPRPAQDEPQMWSSTLPLPVIGQRVKFRMNDRTPTGRVVSYFIEYGWVGLKVKFDPRKQPAWHKKQTQRDYALIFGVDIIE